jgi:hypothetical protein
MKTWTEKEYTITTLIHYNFNLKDVIDKKHSIESIKTVNQCKNRGIYHFLIIIPVVYVTSSLLNIIIFCITKLKCISYTTLIYCV